MLAETVKPKAIWNNIVIAETDSFETVEGNIYFLPGSIKREFFRDSATHTTCSWNGVTIAVGAR